jgi:hypothetical protein
MEQNISLRALFLSYSRNSLTFMGPKFPLPLLQESSTYTYPMPDQTTPRPPKIFLQDPL